MSDSETNIDRSVRGHAVPAHKDEDLRPKAKTLLEKLGVDPADEEKVSLAVQILQQYNTTIHARESDPFLPDSENVAGWEDLRPGTSEDVMTVILETIRDEGTESKLTNNLRRRNEKLGFNVTAIIALSSIPLAMIASLIGAPWQLQIVIVVMGIGGPTAANFSNNWLGRASEKE